MISYVVKKLGLVDYHLVSAGAEINANCPFCLKIKNSPDTKFKFYVHIANDAKFGSYICFRCGKQGRLSKSRGIGSEFAPKEPAPEAVKVELPEDFEYLIPGLAAYRYLIHRGLTPDDITYYNLGLARGRIVFPDYLDGSLVFWVARAYTERTPKYFNCPNAKRSNLLYNLGRFLSEPRDHLIVTEGPISAIAAGRNAVATYGKKVTEDQVTLLKDLSVPTIYLALDADAKSEALSLAKSLSSSKEVMLVNIPKHHDPASLEKSQFAGLLKSALPYDKYCKASSLKFKLGTGGSYAPSYADSRP